MTTLDNIVKLFKLSDETRSQERAEDKDERSKEKDERAQEMSKFTETVTDLIKTGVKDEVESALKPLQEAQSTLSDDHKQLAVAVSSLQAELTSLKSAPLPSTETTLTDDHSKLADTVSSLQAEVASLKSTSLHTNTAWNDLAKSPHQHAFTRPQLASRPIIVSTPPPGPETALGVLQKAKKTLSFSPIYPEDISYLK